jgi:hypothetical protein
MDVESRDSVSLKPAELDELGQLVSAMGLLLQDEQLDGHVEQFPLVAIAEIDGEIQGFLFGSLERIGGTPCILWGLGGIKRGKNARPTLDALVAELYRRAAISFPDEDVPPPGAWRTRPPTLCSPSSTTSAHAPSTRPTARSGPGVGGWHAGSAVRPATTTARSA